MAKGEAGRDGERAVLTHFTFSSQFPLPPLSKYLLTNIVERPDAIACSFMLYIRYSSLYPFQLSAPALFLSNNFEYDQVNNQIRSS